MVDDYNLGLYCVQRFRSTLGGKLYGCFFDARHFQKYMSD